jgi:hypothetical protein
MIMKRRNFLKTLGGIAVMSQIPVSVKAEKREDCNTKGITLNEVTHITIPAVLRARARTSLRCSARTI